MFKFITLLVLTLSFSLQASDAEFYQLVAQLGDEEYSIRDNAQKTLSKYNPEYIPKMIKCMTSEPYKGDAEIYYRLGHIARAAWENGILPTEDDWLKTQGWTGLEIEIPPAKFAEVPETHDQISYVSGFYVTWSNTEGTSQQFDRLDLITKINDIDLTKGNSYMDLSERDKLYYTLDSQNPALSRVKPNTKFTVTVKRFKQSVLEQCDYNFNQIEEGDYANKPESYTTHTFTLVAAEKGEYRHDKVKEQQVKDNLWEKYLEKTQNKP